MRISLDWIADHVDLSGLTPERIADALTAKTALIEEVIDQKAALAGVVVGRVLERRAHPGADRLSLCLVEHGGERPAHVVCGAPNVAAGQFVFYAPVGVTLPNGVRLKAAKIRGEVSEGMICAEDELGLGPEHDGILVLPEGLQPGQPAASVPGYAQAVLDIDNKSVTHRSDLWGHYGFARELAAIFRRELRPLETAVSLAPAAQGPSIELVAGPGCPLYAGLCLEGVPAASPDWLRFRLVACGLRPRNQFVDLSNYVMLETGQPTHPFDRDRLAGDRIVVRRAGSGETLRTLDEELRVLAPDDLVIADAEHGVALAGIMGGGESEVTQATRRVFLESAWFDPVAVRRTSSRLGLRTDALARFEKTLDPALVEVALRRYALLAGKVDPALQVAGGFRTAGSAAAPRRELPLRPELVRARLGLDLEEQEIREVLGSIGFEVRKGAAGALVVDVPSWRAIRDVSIPEDLVEEVGRLAGYERIPSAGVRGPLRVGRKAAVLAAEDHLRDALALQLRFTESMGYSMVSDAVLERTGWRDRGGLLRLSNALQQDASRLRPSVVPGLLARLEGWLRHEDCPRVFEIGRGYCAGTDGLAVERREAVALLAWRQAGRDARDIVRELRGTARTALCALGLRDPQLQPAGGEVAPDPWFHPRRSARLLAAEGGGCVGWLGALAPDVLSSLSIEGSAGLLVLDVGLLAGLPATGRRYATVSRFPPSFIDLAFVLPYDVPVDSVREAIRRAGPKSLGSVEPFDVYRGAPLSTEERSVAFHLVFQAADRTLNDDEVEKARGRIVAAVEALGARLR